MAPPQLNWTALGSPPDPGPFSIEWVSYYIKQYDELFKLFISQDHMNTYLIRTPMERLNACVSASVLLISRENISLPAIEVKGVSGPKDWAMPKRSEVNKPLNRRSRKTLKKSGRSP